MTSSRPYLIRAIYEWLVDSELTPYLLVDATAENAIIPRDYVKDDKIILNIGPAAVSALVLANEDVCFSARFAGRAMEVSFPVTAVMAIYAKENGQGMMFSGDEDQGPPAGGAGAGGVRSEAARKPALKVVK
jgi:stringent starvation protein B